MAIDKDFVIKNGLQVDDDLIYADPSTDKVGIGTTQADKKLVVIGDSEVSQSLTVGTGFSSREGNFTGILTSSVGLDVGIGGTLLSVDTLTKKVGINSTSPAFTLDVRGPAQSGTNAAYIFGDVEVTGSVTAANFTGQVQGGGDLTLNNLTVNKDLVGNNANVYTFFKVNLDGNKFRFVNRDTPPITNGFPSSRNNPTIYLTRGQHFQFELNTPGSPFYIKTSPTTGLEDLYNDGVVRNGSVSGICTFIVPYNAPNILYYQSSTVSEGGKIILNNDGETQTSENLTVTGSIDGQGQSDFNDINVSGTATITELRGPNSFSVSAGILTVTQVDGIASKAKNVDIKTTSSADSYQLVFAPTAGSGYKELYIDSQSPQLTYNAETNKLTVGSLDIRGNDSITGVTTGSENILLRSINGGRRFNIPFFETSGTGNYTAPFVDTTPGLFSYNPVQNKLFVNNIEALSIAVTSLSGVATGASKVAITSDTQFSPGDNARILFVSDNDPDTSRFDEVRTNKDLKFNRNKGLLIAGGFQGVGSTITNLNGSNIDRGEVGVAYLPDASTSTVGVTSLSDSTSSNLSTVAATSKAVKTAFDAANANVPLSRLPDASTSSQGVVRLENNVTSNNIDRAPTARALKFVYDNSTGNIIPSGSKMLFYNASAPTSWTKDVANVLENTALRVVTGDEVGGTVFSGGSGFTQVFKSDIQIPLQNHSHFVTSSSNAEQINGGDDKNPISGADNRSKVIGAEGTGGPDTGGPQFRDYTLEAAAAGATADSGKTSTEGEENDPQLNFAVNYVNVIICTKDAYPTAVPE